MNCKNLTILFLLQGLLSCAIERPKGKTEAEILYKEAQKLMKDGRYLLATEKLNTIRSQYPYSYYATHAELLSADVLFAQKNFVEAAAAYIVFKDFHPKHKKLSFVLWRIGESFFKQMPSSFDRDLASGIESIKYFKRLIDLYPESEYASKAKERIAFCKKQILLRERYVADFYYKTSVYHSARYRYLQILQDYRKNQKLREHSMVRIVYASAHLGEKAKCLEYHNLFAPKIEGEGFKRDLAKAKIECQNIVEEGKSEESEN